MNHNDFPTLLATGFVVDAPGQGTLFPAAGGNSADPRVQAVYWRCLIALFASARITNPGQRLALFCNIAPPLVKGVAIAEVLDRYRVELHRVPLTARLPSERAAAWGNVLYFRDILDSLRAEPDDLRVAVIDSDVLVTASLTPLWGLLDTGPITGYVVGSTEDQPINGMTRRSMAQAAEGLTGKRFAPLPHFGGELFATTIGAWKAQRWIFAQIIDQAIRGHGPAAEVRTEEHVYSIASALLDTTIVPANAVMKRIWTSPRHNTAQRGRESGHCQCCAARQPGADGGTGTAHFVSGPDSSQEEHCRFDRRLVALERRRAMPVRCQTDYRRLGQSSRASRAATAPARRAAQCRLRRSAIRCKQGQFA